MRTATVYALCCRTSGHVYIGKTVDLKRRLREHRTGAMRECCSHLARAIHSYGWDDFIVMILAQGVTEAEAFRLEKQWIADLDLQNPKNGYNQTAGGEGASGRHPSDETRRRLRDANLGWKHTELARSKISAAKRGKRLSPEHRLALSKAHRGKIFTAEHRRRMAEAKRGIRRGYLSSTTRRKMSESQVQRRLREHEVSL